MEKEKNKKMQDILKELEEGVSSVFTSDNYIQLLNFMGKFHHYSYGNCLLILSQCPAASHVASFQTWRKLGFPVKKGEKGIRILVPIPYTYQKEQETTDNKGNKIYEIKDMQGLTFRVGYVFDVSQVNGEIPTISNELTENPIILDNVIEKIFQRNQDIQYDGHLTKEMANGYYRLDTKQIFIRPEMASLQTVKTILHEKAHSLLHNSDCKGYTREEAEVQAESIAYCVCTAFGLDTSDYSFGYIASWSNGKETTELKSSLAVIEKTSRELMHWLASATDLVFDEPE